MDENKQRPVSTILVIGIITVFVLAMCAGCSTPVPITVKFPEPPGKGAMTVCPDLQKLKDNAKLSDVSTTVTVNYGIYYECAVKTDAWQEWYQIQRRIFESVK